MSGCEKNDEFKDMKLTNCCKLYLQQDYDKALKDCKDCILKSKDEQRCCFTDCILKNLNLLDSMGFVDLKIAREEFGELVENNATWLEIISEVTSECGTEGKLKLKVLLFLISLILSSSYFETISNQCYRAPLHV